MQVPVLRPWGCMRIRRPLNLESKVPLLDLNTSLNFSDLCTKEGMNERWTGLSISKDCWGKQGSCMFACPEKGRGSCCRVFVPGLLAPLTAFLPDQWLPSTANSSAPDALSLYLQSLRVSRTFHLFQSWSSISPHY